ncbi:hydroxyethylthiazole kinase [Fusibacter sp. 3D3]|uniref:hydroxyethylthiazole kinase n=1 Tax=Fusibacter sp. 3D3 TaxID=1048380 RepID=UPI00085304D8|nr:hydroxyethylthiazole kinase [Fusibacter sp. 3D3]GAU76207.1 hydroxyethylthiazole kinase [Fusibacter sp. 3D3]
MMSSKKIIHVITNDVTRQFVADTITAVGASPIMSETPEEYASIYAKINASVINLGMVSLEKQKVIHTACSEASHHGVPMVVDLVGIHFSAYRKRFALELLNQYEFAVIKGHYDEISALDSTLHSESFEASKPMTLELIQTVSKMYPKAIMVATGATDYIGQNGHIMTISGGSCLLPKVSGTGCVLSGLFGVCLATQPQPQTSEHKPLPMVSQIKNLCKAYKEASIKAEYSSNNRLGQFKIDLISELSEIEVLL